MCAFLVCHIPAVPLIRQHAILRQSRVIRIRGRILPLDAVVLAHLSRNASVYDYKYWQAPRQMPYELEHVEAQP